MNEPFFKDDRGYSAWLDNHPDGFVINANTKGPKNSVLHSARCWTLFPLKPAKQHTNPYRKVCDDDRSVLERWAIREGHSLDDCFWCLGR